MSDITPRPSEIGTKNQRSLTLGVRFVMHELTLYPQTLITCLGKFSNAITADNNHYTLRSILLVFSNYGWIMHSSDLFNCNAIYLNKIVD